MKMTDQISPKFHAEIIAVLFDEYRDLRKVTERVGILLSMHRWNTSKLLANICRSI
jgi:hypothetical protein